MKKFTALVLALFLIAAVLSGCGSAVPSDNRGSAESDTLKIVTTIFPEYDLLKQIIGDKSDSVELTMLLENGVDLHSFQPSTDDIIKISGCDMFIYVGGNSDIWVEDALKEAVNPNMTVIDLMEVLGEGAKVEELVEGMEDEDDHAEHFGHEHSSAPEYDEHIWLSIKNTKVLCQYIARQLADIDSANAQSYADNAEAYIKKLDALDEKYQTAVDNAATKTVLFGDRFPFRYMMDDYGLSYYAAFAGCSAETEASFETILFLAGKVDELGLKAVLTIENPRHRIAQTIIENTAEKNAVVLTMDSMQSTNMEDAEKGISYLTIMESNLEILKTALG